MVDPVMVKYVKGWMQSGELQRRVANDGDWLARLRGKGMEGWCVEEHSWVCSEGPHPRGAMVRWCLLVLVVDEERPNKAGVRVVVMARRVPMGKVAGGVRSRKEWFRHTMREAGHSRVVVGHSRVLVGVGGGTGGLGVEGAGASSGGYKVERKGQGTMEGNGTGSSSNFKSVRGDWIKDICTLYTPQK